MVEPSIWLSKATNRNTQAHWVRFKYLEILFSYSTPIAFVGMGYCLRRANDWGPTTGRHIRECLGDHYDVEPDEDKFNEALNKALVESLTYDVIRKLEAA